MSTEFHTIGLIGKPHHQGTNLTLKRLHHWLKMQGYDVLVEERVAAELGKDVRAVDLLDIGEHCDLAIVVGGMAICWARPGFWHASISALSVSTAAIWGF